jgi:hypothetical protein
MILHRPGTGEALAGAVPVEGLARVFEATVRIRVLAANGTILADTFTTAEAGAPAFGTFAATVSVPVDSRTAACVQVFEESARDGSAVNVVQVEIVLEPRESRIFSFDAGSEDWVAEFADLPADFDAAVFQLAAEHRALPEGLGGSGLFLQGNNASDDLFMFYKRRLDGLEADTAYRVGFAVDLVSDVPEGLVGIGGSPGDSVYVKAGAAGDEPRVVEADDGWLRPTVDKGNQATEGADALNLGTIGLPEGTATTDAGFGVKALRSGVRRLTVTTDAAGSLWVFVGTDSGFEGLTQIYLGSITVHLTPVG